MCVNTFTQQISFSLPKIRQVKKIKKYYAPNNLVCRRREAQSLDNENYIMYVPLLLLWNRKSIGYTHKKNWYALNIKPDLLSIVLWYLVWFQLITASTHIPVILYWPWRELKCSFSSLSQWGATVERASCAASFQHLSLHFLLLTEILFRLLFYWSGETMDRSIVFYISPQWIY